MSDLASGLSESTNSPTSVDTPQTIDSVFEHAESSLSAETTPDVQAPAVDGAVPTIEAPASEPQTPEVAGEQTGPIPFTVHKTALENARTKEREAIYAQVATELEPIKPVLPLAHALAQDVQTGSIAGLNQVLAEYAQHPQLGPQVRSMFGRMLSQMKAKPAVVDTEPEPDLQTGDGALVYSAAQQAKREEWLTRKWQQHMGQEMAPLKQLHERVQQAEKQQQMMVRASDTAQSAIQHWSDQPHFKTHASAIAKEQQALFDQGITDPNVSLGRAYLTVLHRDVLPQQQSQSHQSLVQQAAAKVRASTDNPAASAPAQPRRPRTIDEVFDLAIAQVSGR